VRRNRCGHREAATIGMRYIDRAGVQMQRVLDVAAGKIDRNATTKRLRKLLKQRRKRRQPSGRPHDWRTREDPFAGDWEQVTAWLLEQPELTGVELFQRLVQRSPGRYRPTQVRTLQRGLGKVRARLLVTFDDQWGEEIVPGAVRLPTVQAEVMTS